MPRRTAFTVIELMIIIATTTLLIAILAPVLCEAKHLAWSAQCRRNLNTLNRSVVVYAEQNNGFMMVYQHYFHDIDGVKYIVAPSCPSKTAVVFTRSLPDPDTGLFSRSYNFALLYVAGIITDPAVFYCPAPIEDVRHTLEHYPKPWGTKVGPGSSWMRCGYMWNPWVTVLEWGDWPGDEKTTYEDGLVLDRHPNDRFLTSDLLWRKKVTGHVSRGKAHWNVGFPDGHVERFFAQELYLEYLRAANTGVGWEPWQDITLPYLPGR